MDSRLSNLFIFIIEIKEVIQENYIRAANLSIEIFMSTFKLSETVATESVQLNRVVPKHLDQYLTEQLD